MPVTDLRALAGEDFCYLTTTGRVTGRPHEIEIWFSLEGQTLYMLAGGGKRSDWVKNALKRPEVSVRIGDQAFVGIARLVIGPVEDARARELLLAKYSVRNADLDEWGRSALAVAVDLQVDDGTSRII